MILPKSKTPPTLKGTGRIVTNQQRPKAPVSPGAEHEPDESGYVYQNKPREQEPEREEGGERFDFAHNPDDGSGYQGEEGSADGGSGDQAGDDGYVEADDPPVDGYQFQYGDEEPAVEGGPESSGQQSAGGAGEGDDLRFDMRNFNDIQFEYSPESDAASQAQPPATIERPSQSPVKLADNAGSRNVIKPQFVFTSSDKNVAHLPPQRPKLIRKEYRFRQPQEAEQRVLTDGTELGLKANKNYVSNYLPRRIGLTDVGTPEELEIELANVGYQCMPFYAVQMALLMNTSSNSIKAMLLEGPPGCGKSFMAKSLAKITGAELMTLQCYRGMNLQYLIEQPSTFALVSALTGKGSDKKAEDLMTLGIIARAFLASQDHPVILLIDEIDKVDVALDTFFLGPIQDARIWLESRPPIDADVDNLLILFTKNFERPINDALMRRVHPLRMSFMDSTLEKKVLAPHCPPEIVNNLVKIADIMRYTGGSFVYDRPPAPEELLKAGKYINQLLQWDLLDFLFIGKNVFYILAKSDNDRVTFEQMLRYHPDFADPLVPDNKNATTDQIYARLGRLLTEGVLDDPDAQRRGKAYKPEKVGLTNFSGPEEFKRRLSAVGYQCLDFNASQLCLLLTTPCDRVRAVLLEGPSGCGKSFMAKCLAKITGSELMCLSCYHGMNTAHLIEQPSALAMATASAGQTHISKEKLMNLGILSRAYMRSQNQPTILLIDELDKVEGHIDTFFLGPIQDGRIHLESRPAIDANIDNFLLIFTKNFNRTLDDALLRRLHPIKMTYLDSALERKVLSKHCLPQLIENLVSVADRMRSSGGSYQFERPPAPEELVTAGLYILKQLEWGVTDFGLVGRSVWAILAKSEHDRAVLEHMMRFHPDFIDPLHLDGRNSTMDIIYAALGRVVLNNIVEDPDADAREKAWLEMDNY